MREDLPETEGSTSQLMRGKRCRLPVRAQLEVGSFNDSVTLVCDVEPLDHRFWLGIIKAYDL